jgi:copper chaperone CopZ
MMRLSICFVGLALVLVGCQKRESEQMAGAAADTVTAVAFNVDGAPTVQFDVPDMMCPESCAVKTREILSEQPGVTDVVVDFDSKTATVAIEPGRFDAAAAIAALVDHGFDHSALKSPADEMKSTAAPAQQPAG